MQCKCGSNEVKVLIEKKKVLVLEYNISIPEYYAQCKVFCVSCQTAVNGGIFETAKEAFRSACKAWDLLLVLHAEGELDGN